MKRVFITYGDAGYEAAKARIVKAAHDTNEFDVIHSFDRTNLSDELLNTEIINIKRGGGLWSWKPDIILSTMNRYDNGDILVYCDAGCSLSKSSEWARYWKKLATHDIIAQRIFQRTDQWTRRELLAYFAGNGTTWPLCYQYQATVVVLKISAFTRQFVSEWRKLMIEHVDLVRDVSPTERLNQHKTFIESRHDQSVYSALIYKYGAQESTRSKIYTQWEHIEDFDFLKPQAIRATRLRQGQSESKRRRMLCGVKRLIKAYLYKPFYYAPLQWWYSRRQIVHKG